MKLRNLDLYNNGIISVFVSIESRVFVIECDNSSFNLFLKKDLEVANIMVFDNNDVYVHLAHMNNTFYMIELVNIALDNNLEVFDNDLEIFNLFPCKVSKEDFKNFLESRE